MRVELDEDLCCASGQCVLAAPEVFDQRDEDGVAVVLVAEPPADLDAKVRGAVNRCPSRALALTE
jgi:ferredoxin